MTTEEQDIFHGPAAHASDSMASVRHDRLQADSIPLPGWMDHQRTDSLSAIPGHTLYRLHRKAEYTNLYGEHELKAVHSGPVSRTLLSPDWFFPILLGVFLIYAALRVFYTRFFGQMIRAFVNNNLTNQIVRDENVLVQRASIYLSIVFNVILALFLYLVSLRLGWELGGMGPGFVRFLFFAILVSATYALKFLLLKISGWLFGFERETAIYIFNIFLINNILGIGLMPLIALLAYNPVPGIHFLVQSGVFLIAGAYVYRLGRGILAGISIPGFSPLYLFLYLCTLEIAPLLVLVRLIAR